MLFYIDKETFCRDKDDTKMSEKRQISIIDFWYCDFFIDLDINFSDLFVLVKSPGSERRFCVMNPLSLSPSVSPGIMTSTIVFIMANSITVSAGK